MRVAVVLLLLSSVVFADERDACVGKLGGKRVSFEFQEAPIHQVFRALAKVGDANIMIADDVQGTLTARLDRVRWREALCAVAKAKGLEIVLTGEIYLVRLPGR
jgi:type II secretory pathway component HofQ